MSKSRWPRIKWYTRRLGALERRGSKLIGQKRFLPRALGDGLHFFHRPSEITDVLRRFDELGLSDLLEPPPESKYEDDKLVELFGRVPRVAWKEVDSSDRICTAIGAKAASIETFGEDDPLPWHEFGEREADAWFLTNFAYFYSRQSASYADIDERLRWAHALGSLMECWRWRRKGYDAEAVHGRKFPAGHTEKATKARGRKGADRAAHVIEAAQRFLDAEIAKLRFTNGRINKACLARAVLRGARPGVKKDRVRQILTKAVRDGELV